MRKYIAPSDLPYFPALLGSTLRRQASILTDYCNTHAVEIPESVKEFFTAETLHSLAEPVPTWDLPSWYAFARTFKKCKASTTDPELTGALSNLLSAVATALDIAPATPMKARRTKNVG